MTKKILVSAVLAATVLIVLAIMNRRENPLPADAVLIADSVGDWGRPVPYHMHARGPGYIRMSLAFDTLVWKTDQGMEPAIAESWESSDDGLSWVFRIRPDVFWHDSRPLTAEDVCFTIAYMKAHPWEWVNLDMIESAEKQGAQSVCVKLSRAYAPFLTNVAGALPILPEHVWEKITTPRQTFSPEMRIGSGPYCIMDYNKAQGTYLFEAWKRYYGGMPEKKQIRFVRATREIAPGLLAESRIHASAVPAEAAAQLKKQGLDIVDIPLFWAAKMMINHRRSPLDSLAFRKGLACAIDRKKLVDIGLRGHGVCGSQGLIPPTSPWYNSGVKTYTADPVAAADFFKKAGLRKGADGWYTLNSNPFQLEMLVRQDGIRISELIQQDLAKAGIRLILKSLEPGAVDARVLAWNFDMALSGHGGLGGDPEILNRVILGKGFNSARYEKNTELTELLRAQVTCMDRQKRTQLIYRIQEIHSRELPALVLYYPRNCWACTPGLGLRVTPGGVGVGIPIPLNKQLFLPGH